MTKINNYNYAITEKQLKNAFARNWNFLTKATAKAKKIAAGFCTDHNGKMAGVISYSTSVVLNKRCQCRSKNKQSICAFCFAAAMLDIYGDLAKKLARNTAIITSELLQPEDVPVINWQKWPMLRFESFGDLNNEIQVYNYFLMAEINPKCRAALWTKNPDIIASAIKKYGLKKPSNLVIIYSSAIVNAKEEAKYSFIDKTFTVYDPEYIKANNIFINCGARDCKKCGRCYDPATENDIKEQLK